MTARKYILTVLGFILCYTAQAVPAAQEPEINNRIRRMEAKADKTFIKGNFDKAMETYDKAEAALADGLQKYNLKLKMARLYVLLQQPDKAVDYYTTVYNACDTLLSVDDVCFYLDALRQNDSAQSAEVVARRYAFKSSYSRNQRYLNTLSALSNQHYYYNKGQSDYSVKMVGQHTDMPEYWVGKYNGKLFYAASRSRMQDPMKIYYHQTQYFLLDDGADMMENFGAIPRDLHGGPVAFSKEMDVMVSTGIKYRSASEITDILSSGGLFVNQLYYSVIDKKNKRWSRFMPLFENQESSSYAHPTFFNDDKSIVFSSNRPGGYGGMDLYVSHWDEQARKWGEPINMGPQVNTQGDEIYPLIVDEGLFFSSNGLEGYGGYDLYRVTFGRNIVLPGSLYHFPYPINSVYNDFGIFFDTENVSGGYFVSDRNMDGSRDNIYQFSDRNSALSSKNAIGVSKEYSAMLGDLNTITGLQTSNTERFERDLIVTPVYRIPSEGEILLSVYFDFDKAELTLESIEQLDYLLDNHLIDYVSELQVVGYADDLGSSKYNKELSRRRAEMVSAYLAAHNENLTFYVEGRGQLSLSQNDIIEAMQLPDDISIGLELQNSPKRFTFQDHVRMRGKLRRVDIVVYGK